MATVDADVRLGADWARSLVATAVREDAACVLGGVVISAEPSTAWHRFQRLEFAVMQTWIAGACNPGDSPWAAEPTACMPPANIRQRSPA